MSSACSDRLFSEAGVLLKKQRKRMSSEVTKKLVYIRYEKKYRKWMKRLGISVSEEYIWVTKLKKMEAEADGYEDEVQDEDLAEKSY